ncbi:MAG: immunoglobulin-like domain-containing protein [Eubacteriales bacterium]
MKILRASVLVLFSVTLVLFCFFKVGQQNTDKTYPVITVADEMLNVSISATKDDLLVGVTAYDAKDGDLTDKIIVESISRFTEIGVCIVEYAVCDSDNHTASATRKITYVDYERPRFTLSGSLVFGVSQVADVRKLLGATCSIDGDISNRVIITADEYSTSVAGAYKILARVTNSKGDVTSIELPVYIEERSLSAPKFELGQYLTYLKVGDSFDIDANMISCRDYDGNDISAEIITDTNLDLSKPGVYEIHYRVNDSLGRASHAVTTVIVEE